MKWILSLSLCLLLVGCTKSDPNAYSSFDPQKHNQQVVIVHGLARSAASMEDMSDMVKERGYRVCVVDYPTLVNNVETTLAKSSAQIDKCVTDFEHKLAQDHEAGTIHFVGHSLGGLVIRSYLAEHQGLVESDYMGKVVFLGTPNHGSDVADFFSNIYLLPLAGDTAKSLTTAQDSLPNRLPEPDYDFGVIAGTNSYPILKYMFKNDNDGLVSVNSTRLPGMQDFVEVDIKHDSLRSDPYVTQLIMNYLSNGRFANVDMGEDRPELNKQ